MVNGFGFTTEKLEMGRWLERDTEKERLRERDAFTPYAKEITNSLPFLLELVAGLKVRLLQFAVCWEQWLRK